MSKFPTYKLPTIVGGLIWCLGIAGCIQPPTAPLPLTPLPIRQPMTGEELPDPDDRADTGDLLDFDFLEDPEPAPELPVQSAPEPDQPELADDAINGVQQEISVRGRVAFESTCTQCHEATEALTVKKSYDGWIKTINEMVEYAEADDIEIDSDQIVPIATYLSNRTEAEIAASLAAAEENGEPDEENSEPDEEDPDDNDEKETTDAVAEKAKRAEEIEYGATAFNVSCLECHDANRSLSEKKSFGGWMTTIRRMAKKDDADINSKDFTPIARYLSSRSDEEIEAAKLESEEEARKEKEDKKKEDKKKEDEEDNAEPDSELAKQGETAFYKSCIKCHDAERSLSEDKSFSDWMTTIRRMAEKDDAEIASRDYRAIATFLSERSSDEIEKSKSDAEEKKEDTEEDTEEDAGADKGRKFDPTQVAAGRTAFYKSCVKCHDAQRSLSKKKSLASWRATVKRMAAKDGADVRSGDVEAISVFLASESAGGGDGAMDDGGGEVSPWTFSSTISTLNRVSSDPIENPGFFVDAWVGADWQSDGPLRATVMACTSCHSDRNTSKGFTFELVEASATLDLKKLLFEKYHSEPTKQAANRMAAAGNSHGNALELNAPQNMTAANPNALGDDSPISTSADLKMGRFVVPFGAYSAFSHPGSYRTLSNPLMFNMGRRLDTGGPFQPVLPAPYSDEGVNLRLGLREYCDRSYTIDLFAINGLQGTTSGANFNSSRSYTDNNRRPAVGGRYTLGNQIFRLGFSGMLGQMQNDGGAELDYHLIGADALGEHGTVPGLL